MTDENNMTVREALIDGRYMLNSSESPWLDATLLLANVMGSSRERILASYPDKINEEVFTRFKELLQKRAEGFPVAYLTGYREFYGRDFFVEEGILCPRPDTEILIEEALRVVKEQGYKRVHDLCTGSGCIALTLSLEHPGLVVTASDISDISESVFTRNREHLAAGSVTFRRTSLLMGITGPLDLIVSNPPYLTTEETEERMNQSWKEPSLALDGGADGLDLINKIVRDSPALLKSSGMLMMEAAPEQMNKIEKIMKKSGFTNIRRTRDLASLERVIYGWLI